MSKPNPKIDVDSEVAAQRLEPSVSSRRRVMVYATLLLSGGALVAVIYLLRLDTFGGWEKSVADLVMVVIAVSFLVALYMAIDSVVRGEGKSGRDM